MDPDMVEVTNEYKINPESTQRNKQYQSMEITDSVLKLLLLRCKLS